MRAAAVTRCGQQQRRDVMQAAAATRCDAGSSSDMACAAAAMQCRQQQQQQHEWCGAGSSSVVRCKQQQRGAAGVWCRQQYRVNHIQYQYSLAENKELERLAEDLQ